jgi:hypothetical protein
MSNKRQKLETIPCVEHARELLLQYLIPDLAAIVLDEYAPFPHGYSVVFLGGTHERNELTFPCCEDCKSTQEMQFAYKEQCGKVRGPFDFETLNVERTMRAGKLYQIAELIFRQEGSHVTFRITDTKSVTTQDPWTCNTGEGIDGMVDIALIEAEKFLARHTESTNVLGSQSK